MTEYAGIYTPVNFVDPPTPSSLPEDLTPVGYITHNERGYITGSMFCQPRCVESNAMGRLYLRHDNYSASKALWYVQGGALVARPVLPYTLRENVLVGVPQGATLRIEGVEYTADGTDIELSFSHSGTFIVEVDPFPYQAFEVEVEYEAPAQS